MENEINPTTATTEQFFGSEAASELSEKKSAITDLRITIIELINKIYAVESSEQNLNVQKIKWQQELEQLRAEFIELNALIQQIENDYSSDYELGILKGTDQIAYNAYMHRKTVEQPRLAKKVLAVAEKIRTADQNYSGELSEIASQKKGLAGILLEVCDEYDQKCVEYTELLLTKFQTKASEFDSFQTSEELLQSRGLSRANLI